MPAKTERKAKSVKKKEKSRSVSSPRRKKAKKAGFSSLFYQFVFFLLICVVTGILVFASFFIYQEIKRNQLFERDGIADIVFKQIEFDRFVTISNRVAPEAGQMLTRWSIYYIKGTADIQFDIRNLDFERDRGNLLVRYNWSNVTLNSQVPGNRLPFIVDVNIRDEDFREIKSFEPKAMKEDTVNALASTVGGISAAAGSAAGAFAGWTGSAPAGFIPVLSLPLRGGIAAAGGLLGGIGGGLTGYALMKDFLIELRLADNIGQTSREEIFSSARKLVASEIFFDESLSRQLIDDWKKYMINFLNNYGYDESRIIFPEYEFNSGDGG